MEEGTSLNELLARTVSELVGAIGDSSKWGWKQIGIGTRLHETLSHLKHWQSSIRWAVGETASAHIENSNDTVDIGFTASMLLDRFGKERPFSAGVIKAYFENILGILDCLKGEQPQALE